MQNVQILRILIKLAVVVSTLIECWMKTKMESRKTQLEEEDQEKKTNSKRRIERAKLEGQGTTKVRGRN